MSRRTPETLADYLVVAICPALIMVLVGSLLFFLVEVFYQGQFELRTLWVLAMFVLGIVCLARLSMEEGYAYASMYGVPLGVLVGLALSRFVQFGGPLAPISLLVNWALMGFIWWCTDKLTWDCTLIDDSQDASGEGLLQQMGLDSETGRGEASVAGPEAMTTAPTSLTQRQAESTSDDWWRKWIDRDNRPHPPGVWVVYFSLGALPLFGIGGRFISPENLDSRRWCFWMLVLYVASAMCLLLATSFLGLRKYLRQRRLEMPLEMAAAWVGFGTMLIVATIIVATMLPRPSPEYSIAQVIKIDSPELWASKFGFGPEGAKNKPDNPSSSGTEQKEGQRADRQGGGKSDPNNKQGSSSKDGKGQGQGDGKSQQTEQSQNKSDSSSASGSNSQQGNQSRQNATQQQQTTQTETKSERRPSDQGSQDHSASKQNQDQQGTQQQGSQQQSSQAAQDKNQSQGQNKSKASSPDQSSSGNSSSDSTSQASQIMQYVQRAIGAVGGLLKAAFYLAIVIVAAILAWRYRAELIAAWKKLLAELAALWPGLFGSKKAASTETESAASAPPRPFAQFSDPFASGQAARMSPAQVVRYTFAALEAWGCENGCPRAIGQTPHEYAAAIGELDHSLGREAMQLADLYARLAYAPPAAIRTSFEPLRSLWRKMTSPAVEVVGA